MSASCITLLAAPFVLNKPVKISLVLLAPGIASTAVSIASPTGARALPAAPNPRPRALFAAKKFGISCPIRPVVAVNGLASLD